MMPPKLAVTIGVAGTQMCQLQRILPAASLAATSALPGCRVAGVRMMMKSSANEACASTLFGTTSELSFQVSQRITASSTSCR